MKSTFCAIVASAATLGSAWAAPAPADPFPDSDTIPIVAWVGVQSEHATKERFEELKDAGFNINLTPDTKTAEGAIRLLDCAQAAGVKCLFTCKDFLDTCEDIVPRVKNHPALAGYYIYDEPNEDKFPMLGERFKRVRAVDSMHLCYVNLLPNYGVERKGLSYEEHVRKCVKMMDPEFISYDQYPIFRERETGANRLLGSHFANLEIFMRLSRELKRPFWAFALATSYGSRPSPDLAQLRFQMYSNLAYGAQGLQYFTFWSPSTASKLHDAPIGYNRLRGFVYERIREMNAEIQARAFVFKGATPVWVHHTGKSLPKDTTRLEKLPDFVTALDTKGRDATVSLLQKGSRRFLMIVNGSYFEPLPLTLRFTGNVRLVRRDGTFADAAAYDENYELDPGDCLVFEKVI